MPTEEYAKMTTALCSAVENHSGAILTSYGSMKKGYFGGITMIQNQHPRILDEGLRMRARFQALEAELPGEWPSWKTKVLWDTNVLISEGDAYQALVFVMQNDQIMNSMLSSAKDYERLNGPSDFHQRPYYMPVFTGLLRAGMTSEQIRIVHPEKNIEDLAVRHLFASQPAPEPENKNKN